MLVFLLLESMTNDELIVEISNSWKLASIVL